MHALLLAAGLGTRLRPLTEVLPKPLVPLFDRPLAAWALGVLGQSGVTHVVANTHHLGHLVAPALRPWAEAAGLSFETRHETTLLGTGGAIRNVLDAMTDDFLVFNGDVLATPDLARAIAHHRATGAELTMVLREDPRAAKLGAIEVTADGRVVRMLGEGSSSAEPTTACLFTGVYVVSKRLADLLPVEGCVVRVTLRTLLAEGRRVSGVIDTGAWFDLGTIGAYADVHQRILRGEIASLAHLAGERWLGEGATVAEGARVHDSVIGAGARIEGSGAVERVIAWPGARLSAPLSDAVVVGDRVVVVEGA